MRNVILIKGEVETLTIPDDRGSLTFSEMEERITGVSNGNFPKEPMKINETEVQINTIMEREKDGSVTTIHFAYTPEISSLIYKSKSSYVNGLINSNELKDIRIRKLEVLKRHYSDNLFNLRNEVRELAGLGFWKTVYLKLRKQLFSDTLLTECSRD